MLPEKEMDMLEAHLSDKSYMIEYQPTSLDAKFLSLINKNCIFTPESTPENTNTSSLSTRVTYYDFGLYCDNIITYIQIKKLLALI